ncbi:MAG TPA: PPOX class F420-dependent oxidoreductase [Streptosporangiaceae bacterium]|jgi:PPOX class probable F420-dependent enzyme
MAANIPEGARHLIDDPNFATLATIDPDGRPQLSVVWAKRDGDDILVSTTKARHKAANLARDPRATYLVYATGKPYTYLEVRGHVTVTDDTGRELVEELAHKYIGRPYPNDGPDAVRLVIRITPDKVVFNG